jgi:hypothetical protein
MAPQNNARQRNGTVIIFFEKKKRKTNKQTNKQTKNITCHKQTFHAETKNKNASF